MTRRGRTGPSGRSFDKNSKQALKAMNQDQALIFNSYQRFDLLEKHGCTTELASRLTYAYDKVSRDGAMVI